MRSAPYKAILFLTLLLLVLGVGYWNWQEVQQFVPKLNLLATPQVFPTLVRPTSPPPKPIPTGSIELIWNPAREVLIAKDGSVRFKLSDNGDWKPFLPDEVAARIPQGTQPEPNDSGIWTITDQEKNMLFTWDSTNFVWIPAGDLPVKVGVSPDTPDKVSFIKGDLNIIIKKTDGQILQLAPELDPNWYRLPAGQLKAVRVLLASQQGKYPYLIYEDSHGKPVIGWDVGNGTIEHIQLVEAVDTETDFTIRVLLITDNSYYQRTKSYYVVNEDSLDLVPKAILGYTLPLNYLYGNQNELFQDLVGMDGAYDQNLSKKVDRLGQNGIAKLLEKARSEFRLALQSLPDGQEISIPLGMNSELRIVRDSALIILRIQPENHLYVGSIVFNGPQEEVQGAFTRLSSYSTSLFQVRPGQNHSVEVVIASNQNTGLVGGFLVEILREMTVIGASRSWYTKEYQYREDYRSSTDLMVFDLCGKKAVQDYLLQISANYRAKGTVPRLDMISKSIPVCLLEERFP